MPIPVLTISWLLPVAGALLLLLIGNADGRRTTFVDTGIRDRLLHRRGRHQPAADRAHVLSHTCRGAVVVDWNRAEGEGVLHLSAAARGSDDWRVPVARPVPVLRVLG